MIVFHSGLYNLSVLYFHGTIGSARSFRLTDEQNDALAFHDIRYIPVSYTHLDVYKRQPADNDLHYAEAAETLGEDGLAAIANTMAMFRRDWI